MIASVQQLPACLYLSAKKYTLILLFIPIFILAPFQSAFSQEMDNKNTWSFGFQAGVLSGNLPTSSATNAIVSRFNVENDYYFTAAFQAGYAISEFESLHLTLSRGEFSVFTDYEFWPEVLFKNQFYTATLSTQLGLRRFIGALPNRLDPYGSIGLGFISNRHTVAPFNSQGTDQNDFSDDQSSDISFLITTGLGLDYSLNSRFSLFIQFTHNFLSSDIIDKNLAGDVLRNDFIQTTNNWSTVTSGFRLKFGKSKTRTQPEPDFQIVSTINADRLNEMEEEIPDLSDSVDDNITESDSTDIQTTVTPELPDNTIETQSSEEITEDENLIPQEIPVTEINGMDDDYGDEIIFATQPRYGLMGIAVEEISGSFALNLHSFADHEAANDIIVHLNSEGYRVVTQMANINGIDYLRVAVGQFETKSDARSAAINLPAPYRNKYFIIEL